MLSFFFISRHCNSFKSSFFFKRVKSPQKSTIFVHIYSNLAKRNMKLPSDRARLRPRDCRSGSFNTYTESNKRTAVRPVKTHWQAKAPSETLQHHGACGQSGLQIRMSPAKDTLTNVELYKKREDHQTRDRSWTPAEVYRALLATTFVEEPVNCY